MFKFERMVLRYIPEEVHASYESHRKRQRNNSLILKQLGRHHRVFRELCLIDNPSEDKSEADEEGAEYIGRFPRMSVAAGLQSNKAVVLLVLILLYYGGFSVQES